MALSKNIELIRERINKAAIKANRDSKDIKLLTVTKTRSIETIEEALSYNIEFIGENKVQEAEDKIPFLKGKFKEFHFIGHLQSNKINKLMKLKPTLIHSIDKYSTAKKLNNFLKQHSMTQDVLIEVNTSNEESKFGATPNEVIRLIKSISQLENIKIKGLMTVGEFVADETVIRKCFIKLRELFNEIKTAEILNVEMKFLSMGMTNDFEIAIEEGANIIRIGTAIFGARNY
ncbi:MAG: YggS family pyridoxal phosphate-dependent enzyme [Candidatus Tenebribacter burtonii]|jgi:pyridoxal phosphate enzyme (YggS family)|nr:YggS family pyridoxal phosphate-dependent enzyme [Candidatus Tenebribacter burtonii]